MRHESMVDLIGNTPVVRLNLPAAEGVEVYAKLELLNPFAMKDRVARQVITEARKRGDLAPGAPIVESSSGTMALGLALVGAQFGHPVHIVTDPRIDPITMGKLEALGCSMHVVPAMTGQGWQSARLERLAELMSTLPGAYWPRQYTNPENPAAYRGVARELLADLGRLDVLVGAVGSGGSLCGTARALLESSPDLTVVGVDCVGSVLFAQPDLATRRQSGLGNSLHPGNLDHRLLDQVHWLSDDEAFEATRRLAAEQGVFGGNTSGSVYRVLTWLAGRASAGTRLVGIMPDRGDRYVDSVYRSAAGGPIAAGPEPVAYGTEVRRWSYADIPRRARRALLFVESNTTGTGMLALRTAVRLALDPVLLTRDPDRYPGVAATGAEVIVCDTEDPAALERAVAGRDVAGVTTTSDFYLVAAARLAGALGVTANPPEVAELCRDKARSRAVLSDALVPQPRFATVHSLAEVPDAVALVGLPCVVKPVDESGSRNVLWCEDLAAATAQVGRILAVTRNVRGQLAARTVLVEEYLEGPEYSAEMFCAGGEATCVGLTGRTLGARPHFVETGHQFPAVLAAPEAAAIADVARRALKALRFSDGPAHVELRLTPSGPAVIEINGRLAGGMIPELIRPATGVDLLEQQIRGAAGLPLRLDAGRSRHAGLRFLVADRTGPLISVGGLDQARRVTGVAEVVSSGAPGRAVRPPQDAYDRLGHVIATGDSPDEVVQALDAALALIVVEVGGDR